MEMICTPERWIEPSLNLVDPDDLEAGLQSVICGEQLAVRFPGYYHASLADEMGKRLMEHEDFSPYEKAPDIGKVGTPYYDTVGNANLEEKYWTQACSWNAKIREAFAPNISPIDRVHIELDERWPTGLQILRNAKGQPAFAGLARVFGDGAQALPHVDRLEWDAPAGRFAVRPKNQIALNVYLRMPSEGGELVIWDLKPDRDLYERLRITGSYGLDRMRLPAPALVIKPEAGELILFDAQNVHAVLPSRRAPRVTVSFFIVVTDKNEAFIYS